ncbi:MAG: SDR family oxidoreductase [Candidatus Latescibacteria bacterium]|nr:SDR family oxidoreductase [Candidatus Latescibacterota bacterium]MDP7448842.1 SDR family oxidoreductase [Candidatus Latescibacterota bacterium]HJP29904.1 SDR family oxidoreductase [Candidatus Latescibacterota bacterium]
MNVLVTGGSRGIGRAIVTKLVAEGKGCAFTFVDDETAAEETIAQAREQCSQTPVRAYRMNVRYPDQVEATTERVLEDFGDLGAVVNNAAIVRNGAAALMSDEDWDAVLQTDLSGPFYVIRSLLMHFLSNGGGRIVNISSLAADGSSGQANYAAAKAGLIGLTRTVAKEYGAKGITSNAVTVGYVETDMTSHHMTQQLRDFWVTHCPQKRPGTAQEAANLVHFLLSDEAAFVNGEIVRTAGGLTYAP